MVNPDWGGGDVVEGKWGIRWLWYTAVVVVVYTMVEGAYGGTFACLGLLQQLHDGPLCLAEALFEGCVARLVLAGVQVVDQVLEVVQLLPLLVHLGGRGHGQPHTHTNR